MSAPWPVLTSARQAGRHPTRAERCVQMLIERRAHSQPLRIELCRGSTGAGEQLRPAVRSQVRRQC